MQNWDTMQSTANYVEHNAWYNNMFAANIKTEPGTLSPPPQHQTQQHSPAPSSASSTHLENYLKQQQQFSAMDTNMTTSPSNNNDQQQQQQQFFDTAGMHQQLMQQQQYQQHFQQAQQAAAQNQVTSHLPLGFNPLTPPGLPNAVIPAAMSHFYTQSTQQQRQLQQTPSPQPLGSALSEATEKSALTPRHTPPMDITPPKSPKHSLSDSLQMDKQDQELMSNSSEDLKYIVDSDDDETIRLPIYNSHGKMKNYKCKSCGMVAITKLAFWDHARTHMKPEKILQCHQCPFVTELKHHLEYHIRKHKNLKPFQCDKCSYSCVNKSMLNSHRKSHSSVYQYRCADCDYATKYCHSFKLHLRKYDHKPGMVLDEEGIPNPSVVIDVYGTRRGPKNKGAGAGNMKKSNTDLKMAPTSQLSAALQGFPMNGQQQLPASPAKSNCSVASELPALTLNMSLQNQQQQQAASQISPSQQSQSSAQSGNLPNLLPPLASLLQQNRNMAFFPYWNLNLQMLAAQQQAAVLAQLSPRMREQLQKQQEQNQEQHHQQLQQHQQDMEDFEDEQDDEDDDEEFERKSVDSAMDLSQGTPTKEEAQQQQTPEFAMNLKLADEQTETPLYSSTSASRRKGRVLKLDQEQMKTINLTSAPTSPQALNPTEIRTASSPITVPNPQAAQIKLDDHSSADESMERAHNNPTNANTSATSTASSSGNSSNSSSTTNSSTSAASSPTPTMYECKYCDIFFKDAVLYTIHMGYHSCDDVFKCNMCGEKCDGPVGLFVHMARNAHS